jgi:hypothetical protein
VHDPVALLPANSAIRTIRVTLVLAMAFIQLTIKMARQEGATAVSSYW